MKPHWDEMRGPSTRINRKQDAAPGHGPVSAVWLGLDGTKLSAKVCGSDRYTGPEIPRR